MAFRPLQTRITLYGWLATVSLTLIALFAFSQIVRMPPSPGSVLWGFVSLISGTLALVIVYRLWLLTSLDYWVERDGIRILWAGHTTMIPMAQVQEISPATASDQDTRIWLRWPALWFRPQRDPSGQVLLATRPPTDCLAVRTAAATYLVSPGDEHIFMAAFQQRQDLGTVRQLPERTDGGPWLRSWLWQDRVAQILLAGGLILVLASVGYLMWHFPRLPAEVPIHFNASGLPDRISPQRTLFLIPLITGIIFLLNAIAGFLLYQRQRFASYLLWGSAFALQIIGWLALRNLVLIAFG